MCLLHNGAFLIIFLSLGMRNSDCIRTYGEQKYSQEFWKNSALNFHLYTWIYTPEFSEKKQIFKVFEESNDNITLGIKKKIIWTMKSKNWAVTFPTFFATFALHIFGCNPEFSFSEQNVLSLYVGQWFSHPLFLLHIQHYIIWLKFNPNWLHRWDLVTFFDADLLIFWTKSHSAAETELVIPWQAIENSAVKNGIFGKLSK